MALKGRRLHYVGVYVPEKGTPLGMPLLKSLNTKYKTIGLHICFSKCSPLTLGAHVKFGFSSDRQLKEKSIIIQKTILSVLENSQLRGEG